MRMLLVWENIPGTDCYIIEDQAIIDIAREAHGHYINGGENKAVNKLNLMITDPETMHKSLRNYLYRSDKPIQGPFDLVVVCGFVL